MNNKKEMSGMFIPTVIMAALAVILVGLGYLKGRGQHISGMRLAWDMTIEVIPLLVFSFIIAGMVKVLIPQALIAKWVGVESGMRGIFIGSVAGMLSPGGPYVSFPLIAALLNAGASIGTTVAFLTGWSLCSLSRLPMEVGILGWRFTAIRLVSTFFFPPIAGLIAQLFFSGRK